MMYKRWPEGGRSIVKVNDKDVEFVTYYRMRADFMVGSQTIKDGETPKPGESFVIKDNSKIQMCPICGSKFISVITSMYDLCATRIALFECGSMFAYTHTKIIMYSASYSCIESSTTDDII